MEMGQIDRTTAQYKERTKMVESVKKFSKSEIEMEKEVDNLRSVFNEMDQIDEETGTKDGTLSIKEIALAMSKLEGRQPGNEISTDDI